MKTDLSKRQNNMIRNMPVAVPQVEHDYAVQFGDPKRDNDAKAFPFFYNFIRYPYQIGNEDSFGANQDVGIYRVTADAAEGPDGLTLPSMGILDIPVVMDNDTNFHLLYTKFGAFRISQSTVLGSQVGENSNVFTQPETDPFVNGQTVVFDSLTGITGPIIGTVYYVVNAAIADFQISLTEGGTPIPLVGDGTATIRRQGGLFGSREYLLYPYLNSNPASSGGQGLVPDVQRNARIPYWTELDVSMYMSSSAARDLYGGFQRAPLLGATEEQPIPILDLQGSQDGVGMLKTPFQLTKSATVLIRVRSRSRYPLRVYGHLFGYKITV